MNERVAAHVRALVSSSTVAIEENTQLIGDGQVLDSLGLVELCLRIEDEATELGFEFDWTSESAMSRRGMFRTVGTLSDEFERQQHEHA